MKIIPVLILVSSLGCMLGDDARPTQSDDAGGFGTSADLALRDTIRARLWGEAMEPGPPTSIDVSLDIDDTSYDDMQSLLRVNEIIYTNEWGMTSLIHHFLPLAPNGQLVIYHQGHSGHFGRRDLGWNAIAFLLDAGYAVAGFSMPLHGLNTRPRVTLPSGLVVDLIWHPALGALEDEGMETMRFFIDPVVWALDDFADQYDAVHMVGLSGGGFTTHLIFAIDTRIQNSYPVAGSIPFYMRVRLGELGDFEQLQARPFWSVTGYLELYVLAALEPERSQLQIINYNDPCCFSGWGREDVFRDYEAAVQEQLDELDGGWFSIHIDDTHPDHAISWSALDVIAADLQPLL